MTSILLQFCHCFVLLFAHCATFNLTIREVELNNQLEPNQLSNVSLTQSQGPATTNTYTTMIANWELIEQEKKKEKAKKKKSDI